MDEDTLLGIGGSRLRWPDLPAEVRGGIESVLGSPMAGAESQPGGFSPGLAARLVLADGRRVFAKAVGASRNPDSPVLLRREIAVLDALPATVPVARPIGRFDNGEWVAILLADIDGRQPAIPWRAEELDRVLVAVRELAERLTPSPIAIDSLADTHADAFGQWRSVRAEPDLLARLPRWVRENLARLTELEAGWRAAAAGDTLLHADLRADNLLLTEDRVVVVDWPHACTGAAWIDLLAMLPSVAMQGGGDPATIWARSAYRAADPDRVTAVLAAFTGFLVVDALRPAPVNLPRLRAFQRAQGEVALSWLRTRLG